MKVSLVIPCYNEEEYIETCLESIAAQEVPADEVILVDNNSTDGTIEKVQRFDITVIQETKQGISHARNCGFNYATGDIIARCDADTILPVDWIAHIHDVFEDESIDALSGPSIVCDLPFSTGGTPVKAYLLFAKLLQNGKESLLGFNMAIRRSMWDQCKDTVCMDDKTVHEDVDLALCIHKVGGTIVRDHSFIVSTSARRMIQKPSSFFIEYPTRFLKTLLHNYHPDSKHCFAPPVRAFAELHAKATFAMEKLKDINPLKN